MYKRQDAAPPSPLMHFRFVLSIMILILLMLSACQPSPAFTHETLPAPTSTFTKVPAPTEPKTATDAPAHTATSTATPSCKTAGGEVHRVRIFSEQLQKNFHFNIYLPACYPSDPPGRYPVVYLLHGLTYTNEQWLRLGLVSHMDALVAKGEVPPFIIVLPLESPFTPPQTSRFDDALVHDLVPWIDSHYQTLPEKEFRGIAGLSRGAAWAVRIGFENSDLFDRVGAHSLPLFEADGANINAWVTQTPSEELPTFFIDIGRNDREVRVAHAFANRLDENNIPHEWYLFTGGHTEDYWSAHLEQYLRWYARDWLSVYEINEVK